MSPYDAADSANKAIPKSGLTALQLACEKGHLDAVEVLLGDHQLDPNLREPAELNSALHLAVMGKHASVVRLLINDSRVNQKRLNLEGLTPYFVARKHGTTEICDLLKDEDQSSDIPTSALMEACIASDMELLERVLGLPDVDVNYRAPDGDYVSPLTLACTKENLPMVQRLLRHPDIDPNVRNVLHETPLHEMAKSGFVAAYQMVLDHPDTQACAFDDIGRTPLATACSRGNMSAIACHFSTDKGLEFRGNNASDPSGPFMQAVFNSRLSVVKTLLVNRFSNINNVYAALYSDHGEKVSEALMEFLRAYKANPTAVLREQCGDVSVYA